MQGPFKGFEYLYNNLPHGVLMKQVWEKPRPKNLGKSKNLKGNPRYQSVKLQADKKFGKKTSLVKNMWISKQLKA